MTIVTNTSPLNYLVQIGEVEVLAQCPSAQHRQSFSERKGNSTGKKSAKAGSNSVPRPNPEMKVSPEAMSAVMQMTR